MHSKLKKIRIDNHIIATEMSRKLKISKAYYSQIENGKRTLSYEMAIKISRVFNLKPDDIFYDDYK